MLKANKFLLDIPSYVPGKSKNNHQQVIKLSSNENALGASKKAIEVYKKHTDKLFRYPDGSCSDLTNCLAEINNINPKQIVCGAGSDEIISLLTTTFASIDDEVLYSEYGFLMYPISAKKVGAKPIKVLETNLKTNLDNFLNSISSKTKIIFIANPNNPTGSYVSCQELENFLSKVPNNILVVFDHAYQEFVTATNYYNSFDLVEKYQNLVITRTFSKIYGLASLRIGWSYSSLYVAEMLHKVRGPFNVNGAGQLTAIASLQDVEFLQESVYHNSFWLEKFQQFFANLKTVVQYPSVANFVLVDFFSQQKAQEINEKLLENGIIIRDMASYNLHSCLRISIGNNQENQYLLDVLQKILV